MIDEATYVRLIADLLNRNPNPRVRERLVREANRALYPVVVGLVADHIATIRADLALARVALVGERDEGKTP